MRKKLLLILALAILVTSTLAGCSGAPSDSSTLTIFSITDGTVLVMKAGTDDWTEATVEMPLEVGDTIKTGDDSGAEITFFDGSTIELEAGTQIEITSLDTSPDTGTKTITLMQTIGTTISRVTKLLDPASSYDVETPDGVAAVRGSVMIVRIIFNDPNYEDGTVLITNLEGHIYFIGQGEELQIPEGAQVVATNETAELVQLSLAADDGVTTLTDTPVAIAAPGVLANDLGLIVGDTLALAAVDTSGTKGMVTGWGSDGSFTYDPNGQFEYLEAGNSTTDSFTYTVTDEYGITDTATVTITLKGVYDAPEYYPPPYYPPVNHPPVAGDDTAVTSQNTSVTINVLNNDSDPNGDALAVTSVTPGTHGSVTITGSSVTYTPDSGFAGIDSFTYAISDGKGGTDTARVTITVTVTNINNPPVARDDSATTSQDTPITVDVLDNDSDPDGDMFSVASVGLAGNGSVTNNGNNVTYTPALNFTGSDSFTYTISDGHDGTDTATVTITVTGTVVQGLATIGITIDTGPTASIFIWDNTIGAWATDEDTGLPVNGENHVSSGSSHTISVAGGHSYCVSVGGDVTRYVKTCPAAWSGVDTRTACGYAAVAGNYPVHFTQSSR
jgi:VCBS repeat-containing protein